MSTSALALLGYAMWTLMLLSGIALLRLVISVRDRRPPNRFSVGGEEVSPFSARLCRAHANCYENLPLVGAILLVAWQSGNGAQTDGMALWLLAARVAQSTVHLMSTSVPAVCLRFSLQSVQIGILIIWTVRLMAGEVA